MVNPPISHSQDEELLSRLREGNREAFEQLYLKYWRRLFDSAYKRLLLREETEEIVQDLFVNIWVKRETLLITTTLEQYLYGSLRYSIYNFIRSSRIRETYLNSLLHTSEIDKSYIEDGIYYEELSKALDKCIESMPEKFKNVYVLSRKQNLTYKEIAQQLNLPLDTVEKHMGRALKILRENLKDFASIVLIWHAGGWH
ncbi:ECF RNA polymerase sigma factor SigW [Dyadobacter sp. CECT 9275]|uniref:ECF RNA polymerase sigma factor SigW n=1 Tax=Dyadobacter helix TaxID=2822344 RepID=A0A916JE42_9BACT|nr:RNA polymerase sigma-70 factor [Dyadobacter sp. CECT 9275]CAG5008446.1 ECF RNA polymerase sigma factor SigW [Dyadobacter sp. CECT 9275]